MDASDILVLGCPMRQVLDRVGDKWSVLVVAVLSKGGPRRFTELRDTIGGVTPKVLTQTLRGMERDGLLTRTVFAQVPPRVDYELTPLGWSLRAPLEAILEWAEKHITEVTTARDAHDATHSAGKAAF
ncbi:MULTISPECIES: helix-turn-helix domain-containing protein [unclassified Pseudofrankia]|uniref:winged helix-turn-helix transcriptional regulator n=1 Tax=unclassified Pseudofrankia TaxID=2994372 RepID=UPI0008D9F69E|nr:MULTISPECIES: helix-turn-helix domain-containing protein [unclassified Pseudofrankia]MDT3446754.1 helix-turn-helix domain-containing protein [Pseudofrankia sp. BMG5.37]OHV59932.1 HxlR family transcriptional regulator [Pseudofrankia sp. BMG5.36]